MIRQFKGLKVSKGGERSDEFERGDGSTDTMDGRWSGVGVERSAKHVEDLLMSARGANGLDVVDVGVELSLRLSPPRPSY